MKTMPTVLSSALAMWALTVQIYSQVITFSDGIFANSDWTGTKIVDTTTGAAATFSATQLTLGGNPDEYRRVTHNYNVGLIVVAHLSLFNIDPAACPIDSIDASYDLRHFNPPAGQAVAFSFLLLQNGTYYRSSLDNAFNDVWTDFTHNDLTANDFFAINLATGIAGPGHPNFSSAGDPIQFGYASHNSSPGSTVNTRTAGVDNYSVAVQCVPEPGTCVVGFALCSVIAATRARSRRRNAA